jgi:ABC-type multidrug transport system fused ATPase/permease subunit
VPPLGWALLRSYRREIRVGGLFHLGFATLQLLLPFLIGLLLDYLETGGAGVGYGVGIAVLLGAVSAGSSYCIVNTLYWMRRLGLNMRSAVMMGVYDHALRLSPASRQQCPAGRVLNLMSVDADKLFLTAHYLHALWHGPLATLVVLALLSAEIGGVSAASGIVVLVLMLPVQQQLSRGIRAGRGAMSGRTDRRVRLTSEVLTVVRAVKYYAWERSMADRIEAARRVELRSVYSYLLACGFLREAVYFSVMVCAFVIFVVNVLLLHRGLSVVKVFRVIAYLNTLRYPINLFGQALKFMSDLFVSVERLDAYFRLPVQPDAEGEGEGEGARERARAAAFLRAESGQSEPESEQPPRPPAPPVASPRAAAVAGRGRGRDGSAAHYQHWEGGGGGGRVVLQDVTFTWAFDTAESSGTAATTTTTSSTVAATAAAATDEARAAGAASGRGYHKIDMGPTDADAGGGVEGGVEMAVGAGAGGAGAGGAGAGGAGAGGVFTMPGLTLRAEPGELIAVIGAIGGEGGREGSAVLTSLGACADITPVIYYTVLYCDVLYYTVLYCAVLCCDILYCVVL